MTPVQQTKEGIYIKRDDLFEVGGVYGGKVRTCDYLIRNNKDKYEGFVTAGTTGSPQVNIIANLCKHYNKKCRLHIPLTKELDNETKLAEDAGGELVRHQGGYNNVIISHAKKDAVVKNWFYIPFGMEHKEAVNQTKSQIKFLPEDVKRIIVSVGSGMTLAGILTGLFELNKNILVIGVIVGQDPYQRLMKFIHCNGFGLPSNLTLIKSPIKYQKHIESYIDDIFLDPIYEAKAYNLMKDKMEPGDLFWITGLHQYIAKIRTQEKFNDNKNGYIETKG